jgi:hypothetical protein
VSQSYWTPIPEPVLRRPEEQPPQLGWLLRRAWQIYREMPGTLLTLAALVEIPFAILQLPVALTLQDETRRYLQAMPQFMATMDELRFSRGDSEQELALMFDTMRGFFGSMGGLLGVSSVIAALGWTGTVVLYGLVARAVLVHEDGGKADARGTLSGLSGPWLALLALAIATGICISLLTGGGFLVLVAGIQASPGLGGFVLIAILAVVLMLGGLIAAIWGAIRLCLAPAVVVAEPVGPLGAARRSAQLTKRNALAMVGILLITVVLVGLAAGIPALLLAPLQQETLLTGDRTPTIVALALSVPIAILTAPFMPTVLTLVYRHLARGRPPVATTLPGLA